VTSPPSAPDFDEQLRATAPEPIVTWSAIILGCAAALLVGTALQLLMFEVYDWKLEVLPYVLLAGAAALVFMTTKIYRKRSWAPVATAVIAVPMVAVSGYWAWISVSNGLYSYFALASPLAAAAGIGVGVVTFRPCQRAAEARKRLRAQGLDVDFA
jgi:hypothetical protein